MFRSAFKGSLFPLATVTVVLALIVGVLVAGLLRGGDQERTRIENAARRQKLAVEIQQKEALSGWIVAGKIVLGAIGLGGLALGMLVSGAYGLRKAMTIGPDQRGLFPLVVGRSGGAWEVRDPNRAISGVTTMGRDSLLPPGLEREQVQVTGQAQAVQLAAAIASGEGRGGAAQIASPQLTARPMPAVEKSPWESRHVERLLMESGAMDEGGSYAEGSA